MIKQESMVETVSGRLIQASFLAFLKTARKVLKNLDNPVFFKLGIVR
jgi:hypothetical protein